MFLGFAIFATINSTINRCRNFIFDNFLIVSFLCFIALFIPLSWSESSQYYSALPRLVTIFIGLLLYFSLLQLKHTRYFLKYLLHIICLSVVLSSLFTLYQFYVMSPNSYFAIRMEYGRPVGIFQQVNVLASFTATGLATSYYLIYNKKNCMSSFPLFTSVFFNSWVLFLTQSRVGLLAFLLITLYYLVSAISKRKLKLFSIISSIIIISFSLSKCLPYTSGNEYLFEKQMVSQEEVRLHIYSDSLELFFEKPLLGHGYGSYQQLIINKSAEKAPLRGDVNIAKKLDHPHNEALLWLIEGGIFAFIFIFTPFLYLIVKIYKSNNNSKQGLSLLIIPITLHCLTEHPFYQSLIHFITLILLTYYILQNCSVNRKELSHRKSKISTLKVVNIIFLLFISLFAITAIQSIQIIRKYIYEEPSNHLLLSKVTNPFIDYKFRAIQINTLKLELAMIQSDTASVKDFIIWSNDFLQAYPSDYILFERIRAFKFLGMSEIARLEREHAKKLYPQNRSWESQIWIPSSN